MTEPIVKVRNLSHRYTIQWAVKDIDLEISDRGIYGLLGSNGAGKSTIMNIMCGVLKQTKGDVFIKGINMKEKPIEAKKLIGFLPQKPPLHFDLTVDEYLVHCANVRMIPDKEIPAAIDKVMEECGISHFRKRLIRNLSGGYQQRVGIAQAIIHKPQLVILDEPTNGLDPNQTIEVRNLIKNISSETTVILSTHILSEVQATCEHIRMVEEGRMVFAGTVKEFDNYITPSTIFLTLLEPPQKEELENIPGVVGIEEFGRGDYRIKFADSSDIIGEIVKLSVQKEWKLHEIRLEKSSLDTIFAEISKTVK